LIRIARNAPTPAVKSRDDAAWKIALVPNAPMKEVVEAAPADINENSYIAATATPQAARRRRDAHFPGEMNKQSASAT
jgi:hypothetical protein